MYDAMSYVIFGKWGDLWIPTTQIAVVSCQTISARLLNGFLKTLIDKLVRKQMLCHHGPNDVILKKKKKKKRRVQFERTI